MSDRPVSETEARELGCTCAWAAEPSSIIEWFDPACPILDQHVGGAKLKAAKARAVSLKEWH